MLQLTLSRNRVREMHTDARLGVSLAIIQAEGLEATCPGVPPSLNIVCAVSPRRLHHTHVFRKSRVSMQRKM